MIRSCSRIRRSLLILALLTFSASAVMAQHAIVKGTVEMEDGSPVAKAVVSIEPMDGVDISQEAKTNKKGSFIAPFVESGTYRFSATKDGLLIKSIAVKILLPNKQVEDEYSSDVGALQKLPDFRLRMSRTAEIQFVMVPKSYFADIMVVPGDEDATNMLVEANDLAIARKFEESNEILRKLIEKDQATSKICYLLGANSFALKQFDEATRWLEKTLEMDPSQPGLYAYLGSIAYAQGEPERALEMYEKELEITPEAMVVAVNRAVLLVELGRSEDAIEAFKKVIEINPNEMAAYSELAALYLGLGRENEAAEVLAQLEERGSADPALWFNIGAGFANRDLYQQARNAFDKALAIDPEFAEAVREIGYLLMMEGDQAGALAQFEKYLELRPAAADAADIQAIVDALRQQAGSQ